MSELVANKIMSCEATKDRGINWMQLSHTTLWTSQGPTMTASGSDWDSPMLWFFWRNEYQSSVFFGSITPKKLSVSHVTYRRQMMFLCGDGYLSCHEMCWLNSQAESDQRNAGVEEKKGLKMPGSSWDPPGKWNINGILFINLRNGKTAEIFVYPLLSKNGFWLEICPYKYWLFEVWSEEPLMVQTPTFFGGVKTVKALLFLWP